MKIISRQMWSGLKHHAMWRLGRGRRTADRLFEERDEGGWLVCRNEGIGLSLAGNSELRSSLERLQSALRATAPDTDAIAACETELSRLADEITAAIERDFQTLVERSEPDAA